MMTKISPTSKILLFYESIHKIDSADSQDFCLALRPSCFQKHQLQNNVFHVLFVWRYTVLKLSYKPLAADIPSHSPSLYPYHTEDGFETLLAFYLASGCCKVQPLGDYLEFCIAAVFGSAESWFSRMDPPSSRQSPVWILQKWMQLRPEQALMASEAVNLSGAWKTRTLPTGYIQEEPFFKGSAFSAHFVQGISPLPPYIIESIPRKHHWVV